jgi:opacity protein-like surface antigen
MRWKIALLAAVVLAVPTGVTWAQGGLEITPLAGYRWGGGLSTVPLFRNVDTEDTWSYGIGLGKTMPRNSGVEIAWTHYSADVTANLEGTNAEIKAGPLNRDDILLNGYWYAYRANPQTLPFITAGIGASIFSSDKTETIGRFAWSLGAGIRREVSDRFALKIQGLWLPTWVTTGTGLWCDPFYCYTTGTGEFYDQFELSLGLVIKP